MTSTAEDAAFLARVCEQPDDDGPRLIYADYLDEMGDPRGAFIRVQCALAQLADDDPRRPELADFEQRLLARHYDEWTAPLQGLASRFDLRRGFVEVVYVDVKRFLERGDELFRLAPIRHALLHDVAGRLGMLVDSRFLGRLAALTVQAQHLGDPLAKRIAESPNAAGLRELFIGRNRITDQGVEALARSNFLGKLHTLDLGDNEISDRGAADMAASQRLAALRFLELRHNEVTFHGLAVLTTSPRLTQLETLGLRHNRVGTLHHYRRGAAGVAPGLRRLDLAENGIVPPVIEALIELFPAPILEWLELSDNRLADTGAELLARAAAMEKVQFLGLARNSIGDPGLQSLAASERLGRLTNLNLTYNHTHDVGARALLDSVGLRSLRELSLRRHGLMPRTEMALRRRFATLLV